MSIAKMCMGMLSRDDRPKEYAHLKGRMTSWRYDGAAHVDVEIPPRGQRAAWFQEYERILRRVFRRNVGEETICEAWRKASAFKQWWDEQQPPKGYLISWQVTGWDGALHYSPERGRFVRPEVHQFFNLQMSYLNRPDRHGLPGVIKTYKEDIPYMTRVWNPSPKAARWLRFWTQEECHYAWANERMKELMELVETETDLITRHALQVRVDRLARIIREQNEIITWL